MKDQPSISQPVMTNGCVSGLLLLLMSYCCPTTSRPLRTASAAYPAPTKVRRARARGAPRAPQRVGAAHASVRRLGAGTRYHKLYCLAGRPRRPATGGAALGTPRRGRLRWLGAAKDAAGMPAPPAAAPGMLLGPLASSLRRPILVLHVNGGALGSRACDPRRAAAWRLLRRAARRAARAGPGWDAASAGYFCAAQLVAQAVASAAVRARAASEHARARRGWMAPSAVGRGCPAGAARGARLTCTARPCKRTKSIVRSVLRSFFQQQWPPL